ncbi:MAG: CHAT domain-containing protein, partial [Microcystis aeruginosa G11-01]|nr:CHAT domain-containing protein [Microcystis aeruginosa G11-01]
MGQEPVANLERAIANYTEAATIFRQPGLERDLALTLTNLGVAYSTQAELGQEPVANLERAIANYREALSFLNPTLLPADTLRTGRNLGNLGFKQGWWDIALEGYGHCLRRLQGRTVTPDSYLQLLKQVQALLSSHHATSRPDDPLNSHLVLDGEQKVTLRDLISPSWRFPELSEVFLSCCETGLSFASFRDEEGNLRRELLDEPLSLGTGFLLGGARSVISSHWAVADLATTLFSREYHRARRAGEERLTALHQARQALRETCQKDWRDRLTVDYQQAFQ